MTDSELAALIPEWVAFTRHVAPPIGCSKGQTLERARQLYDAVVCGLNGAAAPLELDDDVKDATHAVVYTILPSETPDQTLKRTHAVYEWISGLPWRAEDSAERLSLLRAAAKVGWESVGVDSLDLLKARRAVGDGMNPTASAKELAEAAYPPTGTTFSTPYLLDYCERLATLSEYSPRTVRPAAIAMRSRLEREFSTAVFDEKIFFMAELARQAGIASRHQGEWDEAERWLNLAELGFADTLEPAVGWAKVAWSRLAILHQRLRLNEALEGVAPLSEIFDRFGLTSFVLKCKLLEACALKVNGRPSEAIRILEAIPHDALSAAGSLVKTRVLTQLADNYQELGRHGDAARALKAAADRIPDSECSISSADFRTVFAYFLRGQGRVHQAAELFRRAKSDYLMLGMSGWAAYVAVILAETELMLGLPGAASAQLLWALPVLQERGTIPEGCAALALLQESIRRDKLDPQALRQLKENLERER